MTISKDPEVQKLSQAVLRLEKICNALHARILQLEKQNKKLRGSIGRTNDQIGSVERRIPRG